MGGRIAHVGHPPPDEGTEGTGPPSIRPSASPARIRKLSGILVLVPVRVALRMTMVVVVAMGMIVGMDGVGVVHMVVDMAIEREGPASPAPKSARYAGAAETVSASLAAHMTVEADDAVRRAHDDVKVMADHQHRDTPSPAAPPR